MNKIVLGIYIDGLSMQATLLSQDQGLFRIEQIESFKLFDSFENYDDKNNVDQKTSAQDFVGKDPDNPFGLDIDVSHQQNSDGSQTHGNIDVIIELITKMSPPGCPIAFNLQNSDVFYKTFQVDNKTNASKIKKLILKEFSDANESTISSKNIDFIKHDNGECLGMFHNDPLIFSNLLQQAFQLTHRPQSSIYLIDTIEFALAEYICKTININEQDRLSVIFFSQNFTKIFFMKGSKIEDVLPTIHTGAKSSTVCETAFSKILYEFDFKGIDAPQTLFLAGEVNQVNAEIFFKEKFPDLDIVILEPDKSLLSPELENAVGNISPYCSSIALATKALMTKKEKKYKANFLPKRIRERQSQFIISWHGFAALGILFLTILFLFSQNAKINKEIYQIRTSLDPIDEELLELRNVEHNVDSLRTEISNIETGTSLIDSLASSTTRWSPLIETFSQAYDKVGFFNINKFETVTSEKMVADLNLSNREQVAEMERFINKSKVLTVKNTESENADELLQLIIECDLSNQSLNKKQVDIKKLSKNK